ncbi:fatty acid-binding protein, liver-like [Pseudophryne corroboree]|uniref:fatty acid-binding protein, liver-like n=1 Tax=Pseudophryne corroboree TaxID=495146 RepID=UPI0030816B79
MSFSGTYEQQSQENFVPFMTAIGLPEDLVERGKDLKSVTEIVQTGNHFVITITTGPRVLRNEFTIGVETEMKTLAAEKVMSTANLVDGKLVVQLKGVTSVAEVSGDLLITVMTLKDLVYKNISKRV